MEAETGHDPSLSFSTPANRSRYTRGAVVGVAAEEEEAELERRGDSFFLEPHLAAAADREANLLLNQAKLSRSLRLSPRSMPQPPKSSPYRGVTLFRPSGKYRAQVRG